MTSITASQISMAEPASAKITLSGLYSYRIALSPLPCSRFLHSLAPLTGTLPEGNRIGEGPLIPGLWQWQLTLSDGTHSVGSSEFLLMDDQGPRWLTDTPAHLLDTPAHLLDTNNNGNNHKQEEAA